MLAQDGVFCVVYSTTDSTAVNYLVKNSAESSRIEGANTETYTMLCGPDSDGQLINLTFKTTF